MYRCSVIPAFFFLYSKIVSVTKIKIKWLNLCFNDMAPFGPFAVFIRGCRTYDRNEWQKWSHLARKDA